MKRLSTRLSNNVEQYFSFHFYVSRNAGFTVKTEHDMLQLQFYGKWNTFLYFQSKKVCVIRPRIDQIQVFFYNSLKIQYVLQSFSYNILKLSQNQIVFWNLNYMNSTYKQLSIQIMFALILAPHSILFILNSS